MRIAAALIALVFCSSAVAAAQGGEKTYQMCLFPFPCAAKGKINVPKAKKKVPKKARPKKKEVKPALPAVKPLPIILATDPVSQAILEGRLTKEGGGIVSAIRVKDNRIIYRGNGGLSLPASTIPAKTAAKKKRKVKEWKAIQSDTAAARQINSMRKESIAVQGPLLEAKTGSDRMWGEKKKR